MTPWTVALQAPLSMGFPKQEYWNGLPLPPHGYLPNPGIKPTSPEFAAIFFTTEPHGKPLFIYSRGKEKLILAFVLLLSGLYSIKMASKQLTKKKTLEIIKQSWSRMFSFKTVKLPPSLSSFQIFLNTRSSQIKTAA